MPCLGTAALRLLRLTLYPRATRLCNPAPTLVLCKDPAWTSQQQNDTNQVLTA